MLVAVWVRVSTALLHFAADWRADMETETPDLDLRPDPDELVTIATYDKITDAHIALGRLAAEGIKAMLFDDQMVQMDWLYSIALGGIKLRVARSAASTARRVLDTDYSHELDGMDFGKPEK